MKNILDEIYQNAVPVYHTLVAGLARSISFAEFKVHSEFAALGEVAAKLSEKNGTTFFEEYTGLKRTCRKDLDPCRG